MPQTHLYATDAVELAELLQFVNDWIAAEHDHVARIVANSPTLLWSMSVRL